LHACTGSAGSAALLARLLAWRQNQALSILSIRHMPNANIDDGNVVHSGKLRKSFAVTSLLKFWSSNTCTRIGRN
jgi:hypothetical protein